MKLDLVQPIIVNACSPVNALIVDAAISSVAAYETLEHENWDRWLSGRFAKSVRKVKPSQLDSWSQEWGWGQRRYAAAGVPTAYEDYVPRLSKARVEGWSDSVLPWDDSLDETNPDVLITLNVDLGMTPGKAAAQAAHALMSLRLREGSSFQEVKVRLVETSFNDLTVLPEKVIVDAGLTEIAPGSATAFASFV